MRSSFSLVGSSTDWLFRVAGSAGTVWLSGPPAPSPDPARPSASTNTSVRPKSWSTVRLFTTPSAMSFAVKGLAIASLIARAPISRRKACWRPMRPRSGMVSAASHFCVLGLRSSRWRERTNASAVGPSSSAQPGQGIRRFDSSSRAEVGK